jgi:hypothetical protein
LVLLAGFLARLWNVSGTFLNPDEAMLFRLANQDSLGRVYRASLADPHPPLFNSLLHFWLAAGTSELWLRLMSIIAAAVFCWLFFRWLTLVTGRLCGLVGLTFVCLLPPFVRLSAEVRQYAVLLAFLAGALYFLERALAEDSPWLMVASATCLCLAVLEHYSTPFFAAGMGVYALLKILWRGAAGTPSRRVVAVWVAGQLVALAVLLLLYKTHISHLGQGESRTVMQGWMSEFYLHRSYYEAGRDNPVLFAIGHSFGVFQFIFGQLAVGDVAGLMFLAGVALLWRAEVETRTAWRQLALFLLSLFALACGASLAHVYPYGGTRHTAYLIIPAVACVSFATARITGGRWTRGAALALAIVLACAVFGKQHHPFMTRADQSLERMSEALAFLRENVVPGGLIFTDLQSSLVLGHYLCGQKPITVQPAGSQFETFSCGGYYIISANGFTATNFTPEVFLRLKKDLVENLRLKPNEPIWVFQAGWIADLPERLSSESSDFRGLQFHAFGNNIKIFSMPGQPPAVVQPDKDQQILPTTVGDLVRAVRAKAKALENSSGMRSSFQSFTSAYKIAPDSISYPDFVIARMFYEAARDAGSWNMHWTITNMPPNSDRIWGQWKAVRGVSPRTPTASAECDELSALYAFLVERAGVRSVGLFWPYPNHTVAVWVLHPANRGEVRVVVPTSQIFLEVTDSFGTRKFNAWHQKTIFEYKRRDVPDSFELPRPVYDYFLRQVDKYAGASDSTLQEIRYLREGVFLKYWTAETAAQDALRRKKGLGSGPAEDLAAFQNFADDMRMPDPR